MPSWRTGMRDMSTTSSRWFSCAGLLPLLILLLNPLLLLLLPLLLPRAQIVLPIHAIIFTLWTNAIFLLVPATFPVSSLLVTVTEGDPGVGHLAT